MNSTKITQHDMEDSVFDGLAREDSVQAILGAVGNGMIKRIQRGTGTIGKDNKSATVTLSGFTDLSKMVAFVDGFWNITNSNFSNGPSAIFLQDLTLTSLTAGHNCQGGSSSYFIDTAFHYQVIEFY